MNLTVSSETEAVQITYTPSGADEKVWINGFEVDGASPAAQIGSPWPRNLDERIQPGENGGVAASWAPAEVSSPTYDVYIGTDASDLTSIGTGLTDTSVTFTGNSPRIFYLEAQI